MIVMYMLQSGAVAFVRAFFGQGSGQIVLDNVQCNGGEEKLIDCRSIRGRNHDCDHDEDAGVHCEGECYTQLMLY